MSCTECKYAPKTYEEYCIAQSNPREYCPDAFTILSHLCRRNITEESQNKPKIIDMEEKDD